MQVKEPKNSDRYYWTSHVKMKMRQYGLSAQRITRVIRAPERIEEGVATETVAVMQPQSTRRGKDGTKEWSSEVWVMYQMKSQDQKKRQKKSREQDDTKDVGDLDVAIDALKKQSAKIKIISAWRYPAVTKPGEGLPEEVMAEIAEAAL